VQFSRMIGLFVLAAILAFAHHSFTAEFDVEKPVTVTGTVTGIDWFNPHIQVYLDVAGQNGQVEKWHLESGPPGQWHRGKLRKDMLAPGTSIRVRAYGAKDGTKNLAFLRDLTFLSGPNNGVHYELWLGGLDENGKPIYPGADK
jgi:hypothetical protein